METGKVIAILVGFAALGGAGYLYWKKKQGEDEGYEFEDEEIFGEDGQPLSMEVGLSPEEIAEQKRRKISSGLTPAEIEAQRKLALEQKQKKISTPQPPALTPEQILEAKQSKMRNFIGNVSPMQF